MFDVLLTEQERAVRDEARAFVRDNVDPQLLRDMDAEKVEYPREHLSAVSEKKPKKS